MRHTHMLKTIAISLISAATLGFTIWMSLLTFHTPEKTLASSSRTDLPDTYMEEVDAVVIDKQGRPSMKIKAPSLVHYSEKDMTLLTAPQIIFYRKSPDPWFITADQARAVNGTENITFTDHVILHRAASGSNPATLIKTPTLTIYPDQQIAETNALITLIQPSLIVKASGMHADMGSGDIKLLSQAKGEYVPHS